MSLLLSVEKCCVVGNYPGLGFPKKKKNNNNFRFALKERVRLRKQSAIGVNQSTYICITRRKE